MIAAAAIALNAAQVAPINRPKNFKDIAGHRFGRWTAKTYAGDGKWRCVCDCGNVSVVDRKALLDRRSTGCRDCAHKRAGDLSGDRFGHWTVTKKVDLSRWACTCDCGAVGKVSTTSLQLDEPVPGCARCKGTPVRIQKRVLPQRHYKCDFDADP